jgi:hypothetical protein
MTLAEIRDAVDSRLATLWAAIQSRQTAYMAAHNGKAWQGLRTHSVIPSDGATATPDIGTRCPTDQLGSSWPLAIRNTAMEMALEISPYEAPDGTGYQATVWVTVAGTTWTRTAQVGPEVWRTQGWRAVTESD